MKAQAVSLIMQYVQNMPELFFPFLKRASELVVPMVHYPYNDAIRAFAAGSCFHFVRSAVLALKAGGLNEAEFRGLWSEIAKSYKVAVRAEFRRDNTETFVQTLEEIIGLLPFPVREEEVAGIVDELQTVVMETIMERRERYGECLIGSVSKRFFWWIG